MYKFYEMFIKRADQYHLQLFKESKSLGGQSDIEEDEDLDSTSDSYVSFRA